MNIIDLKSIVISGGAILTVSAAEMEPPLKILLIMVCLGYNIDKWYHSRKERSSKKKDEQ